MPLFIDIFLENNPLWLLACLLFGAVVASLLYWRNKKIESWSRTKKLSLWFVRTLIVSLLAALLLKPYLKTSERKTIKPVVLMALDNSASIALRTDTARLGKFVRDWKRIESILEQKYELQKRTFGSDVSKTNEPDFSQSETNLAKVFQYALENNDPKNLGAIIIATDGIYNQGQNPQYLTSKIPCPVFVLALGDTIAAKDLSIEHVYHNKIAYLGDQFPVEIDLKAFGLSGQRSKIHIEQIKGNKRTLLKTKTLKIGDNHYFETFDFLIDALNPGINHFRIRLDPVKGERLTSNNRKDFYINVIDGRQNILIYATAPHPDIGAIKKALDKKKNYQIDIKYASDSEPIWNKYDLVIFHQLPNQTTNPEQIIRKLNRKKTPRLFIMGLENQHFNKIQNTIRISGSNPTANEVTGILSPSFKLFKYDINWIEKLKKFPPLVSSFAKYRLSPGSSVLLNQKILSTKTNYPLLAFSKKNNIKEAVFTASGIWKWRMFDYLENQNHKGFDQLISSILVYLSVKDDHRKFRVDLDKNVYTENESIIFHAELYNKAYELINEPDVSLTLKDQDNKEYHYSYDKQENSYIINIGTLPKGQYTAISTTSYDNRKYSSTQKFSVKSVQLEEYKLQADHQLLAVLTKSTNGKLLYNPDSIPQYLEQHKAVKPIVYTQTKNRKLLSMPWLLALLTSLLAIEWIVRRYSGNY